MPRIYQHEYLPRSIYGNVISLLRNQRLNAGVHIDVGCGYGAIAEPLRDELGLTYIGFDIAEDGLESLRDRGFEVHPIDLLDPSKAETIIVDAIGDRRLASMTFLDTLEHITNGAAVLTMLRGLAERDSATLVLSVPNVTHKDLALKLLIGRWDLTEAGLLDYTHVGFYAEKGLYNLMASIGWHHQASADWLLEHSDQKFPLSAPVLNPRSPLGQFLRRLIDQANPAAIVNQFVRLYSPGEPELVQVLSQREELPRPFLSVVVATTADRITWFRSLLRDLAHQTIQDFEVLAIWHPCERVDEDLLTSVLADLPASLRQRIFIIPSLDEDRLNAINVALSKISGQYVSIFSYGDSVRSNWSATFAEMAGLAEGGVLRAGPVSEHEGEIGNAIATVSPAQLDLNTPVIPLGSKTPSSVANIALPAGFFQDLGIRLDPEIGYAAIWALITEAALLCGLHTSPTITAGSKNLDPRPNNHNVHQDFNTGSSLLAKINAHPLLLPAGSAEQVQRVYIEDARLRKDYAAAQAENAAVSANAAAVRAENSALLSNVADLRDENTRVHADATSTREANAALHSALAELREENLDVHGRAFGLSNAVEYLQAKQSRIESVVRQPLLFDLLTSQAPSRAAEFGIAAETRPDHTPFLSVITRTQGLRIRTLRDGLMCLAGQTSQDFELLIVVHSDLPKAREEVDDLVAEFPLSFREQVRVLTCTRAGRAAPLNDAVAAANGQYIAVLDDDDLVFGHWIETFRKLAAEKPGAILRAVCARQDFELSACDSSRNRPRATSWFTMSWPASYDAVAHLYDNHTPFMSVAFPTEACRTFGVRFDEGLSTTEDWELTTRLAMLCGVVSSPTLTSIYRWWINAESSLFVHSSEEWNANRQRVVQTLNSQPILLPPGSASRINGLIEQGHAQSAQIAALEQSRAEVCEQNRLLDQRNDDLQSVRRELQHRIDWAAQRLLTAGEYVPWGEASDQLEEYARNLLQVLLQSRSWRWTRPLRKVVQLFRGRRGSGLTFEAQPSSFADCTQKISQVHASTSWRITKPVRAVMALLRGSPSL